VWARGRRLIFCEPENICARTVGALLPPEARAALASSFLESRDDSVDEAVEEEWNREIAQRIQELDSGKVKPVPRAEARRQIAALLNGR
jgi:hypothetical protein